MFIFLLTESPNCVSLRNIGGRGSECGCCEGVCEREKKTKYSHSEGQKVQHIASRWLNRHDQVSQLILESEWRCHLQYHKGGKVGEYVVWDMSDLVESERHGLQGWKGVQSHYWDLR